MKKTSICSCLFQDLYRVLLEAESEGTLDDVDMVKVEGEMKSVERPRDVEEVGEKKRTKVKTELEGVMSTRHDRKN